MLNRIKYGLYSGKIGQAFEKTKTALEETAVIDDRTAAALSVAITGQSNFDSLIMRKGHPLNKVELAVVMAVVNQHLPAGARLLIVSDHSQNPALN